MKKIITIIIAVMMVFTIYPSASYAASDKSVENTIRLTSERMCESVSNPRFGDEWTLLALKESDYSFPEGYVEKYSYNMEKKLKECNGDFNTRRYTDYSKVILTYGKLGLDIDTLSEYHLIDRVCDFDKVTYQGINGPVFALMALDSIEYADYEIKNRYIEYILNTQLKDGGWDLSERKADTDITAMVLTALAPYYTKDKSVKTAVDNAVKCLSKKQTKTGRYMTMNNVTSESSAQVIHALSILGINPNTDKRFIKNGKSAVDGLMDYFIPGKSAFAHVLKGKQDQIATQQAIWALSAYEADIPKMPYFSSLKKYSAGSIKTVWKKQTDVSDYHIKVATDKKFTKNIRNTYVNNSNSKVIANLKKGKTYYVKIRASKMVNGNKVYGLFSRYKVIKL